MRLAAACALTTALIAGTLAITAGGASADSDLVPYVSDLALSPGQGSYVSSGLSAGGTTVYVFSKTPLTDSTWAGGGLPAGMTVSVTGTNCRAYAGVAGAYTCPAATSGSAANSPTVNAAGSAANHTTGYVGFGYAPPGTDLATAVKAAQLAGTTSTPDRQTAGVVTVLTAAEVATSTVQLTTPDVPVGSSAVQTVRVHSADPAYLSVSFSPAKDMRWNDVGEIDVHVTQVSGGPEGACDYRFPPVGNGLSVSCQLPAGDFAVTYTLTAGPDVQAWKLDTEADLQVLTSGVGNLQAHSTFKVLSPTPVTERYRLFGRTPDAYGTSFAYDGTGGASTPFGGRYFFDAEPNYTAMTALSPVTEHGTGDVVARDTAGILWYLRGSGNHDREIFTSPAKVGAGWNIYNTIVGARDLTGDGKADLLATDASGTLWLYKGTGNAAAPYATRLKVGTGWTIYNLLLAPGDLTSDGKTDFVARDASGTLWLYKGTGDAAVPYTTRTKIGPGWNTYGLMF